MTVATRTALSFVFVAVACRTPYQPMGVLGGFEEKQIDNGDWLITVKVNGNTDRATALEYMHRRAGELCPSGFDIIDRSDGDNGGLVVTRSMIAETKKPEVNAVVRCQAAAPSRDPTVTEEKDLEDVEMFYCATSPTAAFCTATARQCGDKRRKVAESGIELGPCTETRTAACFGYRRDGGPRFVCAPDLEACSRLRGTVTAKSTNSDVEECTPRGKNGPRVAATKSTTSPSGYFCTSSPTIATVGICTRDKTACDQVQTLLMASVPDVGLCVTNPKAECFEYDAVSDGSHRVVCAPTSTTCGAQRDEAKGKGASNVGACGER